MLFFRTDILSSQHRHIGSNPSRDIGQGASEHNELIKEIEMVNAALFLRRPLLVTGKPGCGKSSLAYMVAYELQLGPVLRWPITTRSTLADGLYRYDAIGRLQDASYKRSISPDAPLKESATSESCAAGAPPRMKKGRMAAGRVPRQRSV